MSEGTARAIVMKAMADFVNSLVDTSDPAFRYTPEQFDKEADAVLAALAEAGALAPAGLTDAIEAVCDWVEGDLNTARDDWLDGGPYPNDAEMREHIAVLRALVAPSAGDGA